MNQKELNEIRRRLAVDKNCINKIYGCFLNNKNEVISYIEPSLGILTQSEKEKYLAILKKTLSGGLGRCLTDIEFTTQQVTDSPEHKILMLLRNSELKNEEARDEIFKKIIASIVPDDMNHLILLTYDTYDVPKKTSDGLKLDDSETVFSYILCAVCPVKDGKIELGYVSDEKDFHSFMPPQMVGAPIMGFMFPTFDDRATNIYNALYYSKNITELNETFIESIFNTKIPMSPVEQKENFTSVLTETLEEDCSLEVIQSVQEQIKEKIEFHKETRDPDPLDLDAGDVANILEASGVPEEKRNAFENKCNETFGENALLNPTNIVETKKFQLETPQVKITVDPEYSSFVETKIIDGRKFILIPCDDGVILNGVNLKIPKE